MLRKLLFREIRSSLGRFLAIMAIIALGVGFFAGLKVTQKAMIKTGGEYLENQDFYDFRLVSTLGLTEDDVEAFRQADGVSDAEGSVSVDALMRRVGAESDEVIKLYAMPERINMPKLISGHMPENNNECVVDALGFGEDALGTWLTVSDNNDDDALDVLRFDKYKIVGIVSSPLYINYERGSTTLGSGVVSAFAYVREKGLRSDIFTDIYLRFDEHAELYSDEYEDICDAREDGIKKLLDERSDIRYEDIRSEAQEKIDDGADEVADAEKELADALTELEDGEKEYADGLRGYNAGVDAYRQAQSDCAALEEQLVGGEQALADGEAALEESRSQLEGMRAQLDAGSAQLDAAQGALDAQRAQFDGLPASDPTVAAALEAIAAQQANIDEQRAALAQQEAVYSGAMAQIAAGEQEFAAQKAQYQAGVDGVAQYHSQLSTAKTQLGDAKHKLDDARKELDDGWQEYNDGLAELEDAKKELADAQEELDGLNYADCYVLGRNTNIGYVCFESDTGIVSGVAKVFPLFFFLVAALVCITTMTRMVDEQRTQIGTLKALGYSDAKIMGKYQWYAMSASIVGSVAGFLGGSYIFPKVLWLVYDIMYDFYRPILYVLDLRLAAVSIIMYLFCTALATWSACKNELREQAAALIRPKSPKAGKRILLERMTALWSRMKFLHKVSARNVFRYKKRMVMMVLGIGGCMALLLTGYGINDSIQNIVGDQFDDISLYDMSVSFRGDMDAAMRGELTASYSDIIDSAVFIHDGNTEASSDSAVKTAYFVAFTDDIGDFICMRDDRGEIVPQPAKGEAVISGGLSKSLRIGVGDTVTLYDENNRAMRLKVSGVYVNYLYNYVIADNASCLEQWGHYADVQTAYVKAKHGTDMHESAARLMEYGETVSVAVSNDMRERVGGIMDNLKYIVLLVIVSAGTLAFIVLYNLTNINLGERVREIATLKVLGFYQGETAQYVLRENIILTLMGAIAGIPMGIALHRYIMAQINIDMITFSVRIAPVSYLISFALCFVFTVVVDLFMKKKINGINMAESLKSAE